MKSFWKVRKGCVPRELFLNMLEQHKYSCPCTFSDRGGAPGNAARNLDAIYCISFYQSNDFPISHLDKDLPLTAPAC